jgi:hypothetical protein
MFGGNTMHNFNSEIMKLTKKLLPTIMAIMHLIVLVSCDHMQENSGTFIGESQTRNNDGWRFSATRANGHQTIFQDLSQENMDNLTIESRIDNGRMYLILSQGNIRQTIDLSAEEMFLSNSDFDMSAFEPGRFSIRFEFNRAENVRLNVRWR